MIYNSSIIKWVKTRTEDQFILNTRRFHKFGIVTIFILNIILIVASIITYVICINIPQISTNKVIDALNYSNCYMASSFDNLLSRNDDNFTGYSIL